MTGRIVHRDSPPAEDLDMEKGEGVEVNGKMNGKMNGESHAITVDSEEAMKSSRRDVTNEIIVKFEDVHYKVTVEENTGGWQSWLNVVFPVKAVKKPVTKEILHGVSGSVLPGEVLAIMGPSGGGKTTFLSILGGRIQQEKGVTGIITYNDLSYSKALKRKMGFVTQDDVFFPHLTVRETLMYAAILRLPKDLTRAQKVQRADDIIDDLGLDRCKNTIIGGQFMRGISGGERKRVSIGHEILIDPSLLFLDEPTSGLDSTTALKIVEVLHKIAKAGKTVITTIHQPSSHLFHSFDKLLLFCEGNSIYFGKAAEAMDYFGSIGFSPLVAMNPADFLLDVASGAKFDMKVPSALTQAEDWNTKPSADRQAAVKDYVVQAYRTNLLPQIEDSLAKLPPVSEQQKTAVRAKRTWNSTWIEQFCVLWTRGTKERRHELLSPLRFYQVLAIALIVGCLWYNSKRDTTVHVTDQIGLLFFISLFWGFFPLITAIFTFPQERAMLMKERASDMYQVSAYFMSRTLSDIPMEWLLPTMFILIVYWMTNLRVNAGIFFLTLLSIWLNITTAQGLGFLIGATVMDVKKGTTLASVVLLTFMLCGGYYLQNIPDWIGWIKYIAFTFYSYRLTMKIQYNNSMTYSCNNPSENNVCHITEALRGMALKDAWVDALALLAMVVGWRALAYLALRRMKTK